MPYNATKIRIKFDKKRLSSESLSNIYKNLFFRKVSNYRGQQVGYVLGELAKEEMEQMPEISKRVIEGVKAWATIGADRAMNVVNTRPQPKQEA